jgi:molybdopterin biosynthesis enzyme
MVITTGGAAVGDYDLLGEAVKNLGGENLFW